MIDIFEILPKIIKNKRPNLTIGFDSNNKELKIKEHGIEAKLKEIILSGFDEKVFSFKLDSQEIELICNIFNKKEKNINKGCDAIIFAEINNKNYIFICELKSDEPKGYIEQFKSTNSFLDYISSLMKYFYDIDISLFERKNILFTTKVNKSCVGKDKPIKKYSNDKKITYIEENNCKKLTSKNIRKFL